MVIESQILESKRVFIVCFAICSASFERSIESRTFDSLSLELENFLIGTNAETVI